MRSLIGKILACLLVFTLILSSMLLVSSESAKKISAYDEGTIIKVYRVIETGLQEVSLSEYLSFEAETIDLSNLGTNPSKSISGGQITEDYYVYYQSSASLVRGTDLRSRVSIIMYNESPPSASIMQSFGISESYIVTPSGKVRVSFTRNDEAAINDSVTMQIPANHYGWFEFDPIIKKTEGVVRQYSFTGQLKSTTPVVAYSYNKINNNLDGFLIARISTVPPTN